jgi:hypothetical protein
LEIQRQWTPQEEARIAAAATVLVVAIKVETPDIEAIVVSVSLQFLGIKVQLSLQLEQYCSQIYRCC